MTHLRAPNVFERILLIIGMLIIVVGYALINKVVKVEGFTSTTLIAIFVWLALICIVIVASVAENTKEELRVIIENQLQELKLLREDIKRK